MINKTVCLQGVLAVSKLLDIVELKSLCKEKEKFIVNSCCVLVCDLCCKAAATICFYKFKLLVVL